MIVLALCLFDSVLIVCNPFEGLLASLVSFAECNEEEKRLLNKLPRKRQNLEPLLFVGVIEKNRISVSSKIYVEPKNPTFRAQGTGVSRLVLCLSPYGER